MPWEYLSLYFAVKPQNPQRSIVQNKKTTLFHNRWVLTKLHVNAELFFNDHLETVAEQPLSEVTPECSWAAQEVLSIWKDCTNHLVRKTAFETSFFKKEWYLYGLWTSILSPSKEELFIVQNHGHGNKCFQITERVIRKKKRIQFEVLLKRQNSLRPGLFPLMSTALCQCFQCQQEYAFLTCKERLTLWWLQMERLNNACCWESPVTGKFLISSAAFTIIIWAIWSCSSTCRAGRCRRGQLWCSQLQVQHCNWKEKSRLRQIHQNGQLKAAGGKPLRWWNYHSLAISRFQFPADIQEIWGKNNLDVFQLKPLSWSSCLSRWKK